MRSAKLWLYLGVMLSVLAGAAGAQQPSDTAPPSAIGTQASPHKVAAVSGNPAATTFSTGTGWLGRTLGLKEEWGIRLGGLWLADTNVVVAGGVNKGGWTNNSALFVGLGIDAEKLVGWRGAAFGFQFLQFNGANTNGEAGTVTGYNSLVGAPPFQRTELYEAFYEQTMIKDVLKMRIGRQVPGADFNNVLRPVVFDDASENIPSVSGLLLTSVFVNTSMLGVLPGYYNPGNGVTVNFTPTKSVYLNLGVYDGNLARGVQTGITPPHFNGYYFNIAEIGTNWVLGEGRHPGQFAVGVWRQTGLLEARGLSEEGTGGFYLFGSQRLAHGVNPHVPSSGITMFYQFGANTSQTRPVSQFYGAGITGFGLVGGRDHDSMGMGVSLSRMNQHLFVRPTELLLQAYYQFHVVSAIFLQPTVTFIPEPAASPNVPSTLTTTLRLTVLF